MIIVGGGVIGCEFASLFAPLGTRITVVEILPRLLAGIDKRTAAQFQRLLEKEGVTVHLGRQVAEITEYRDDGVTVRLDDGTEISAEKLLVSVGRRSQAADIGLEAAGRRGHRPRPRGGRRVPAHRQPDDLGGRRLHRRPPARPPGLGRGGAGGGERARRQLIPMDRTVVPSCIYTHPEIATVGLNADDAKEAGLRRQAGPGALRRVGQGARRGRARRLRAARDRTPTRGSCWAPRSWASTRSR